jgi:hypothetical protein
VDLGQLLTSVLSSIIGMMLAAQLVVWRHQRADRDSAAGRPVSLPAAIRATRRGRSGGVWRKGTINIHNGRIVWTPNTPWGRSVDLTGVGYSARRSPSGPLRWLLPPASVVLSCLHAAGEYELAVLPGSIKHLYRSQFS